MTESYVLTESDLSHPINSTKSTQTKADRASKHVCFIAQLSILLPILSCPNIHDDSSSVLVPTELTSSELMSHEPLSSELMSSEPVPYELVSSEPASSHGISCTINSFSMVPGQNSSLFPSIRRGYGCFLGGKTYKQCQCRSKRLLNKEI